MSKKRWTAIAAGAMAGVMALTMSAGASLDVRASDHTFFVDGEEVAFNAYIINGNNYVKIRDVAKAVDFGVEYDETTRAVEITPDAHYTESTKTPSKVYHDYVAKTINLPESDPGYWKALWEAEVANFKNIRSYPTLFEADGWNAYQGIANNLYTYDGDNLTDANKEAIKKSAAAREALVQVKPFEGIDGEVVYIWGDDMPILTEDVESKFSVNNSWDSADFKPYIVPYLLDDPGSAKGTVIVVSGGGNQTRSNAVEGYLVCPRFNELGYNCVLLQRRVDPYTADEIAMDLQRTVRLVKYYAEDWGLVLDKHHPLAVSGYSGGGGNIRNMLNKFYGDITPDQFDTSYVCDEIDAMNSDVDIAHIIYSGGTLDTENPNLPHMFIAVGEDDDLGNGPSYIRSYEMFKQAQEAGLDPELHVYAQNGHGFGSGIAGTSSILWMESADLYMMKVMGNNEARYEGEVPAKYTLHKTVTYNMFKMDNQVDVYTDAIHGMYYITFVAFNDNQIVEGQLVNDRIASVTYDASGYISRNGDHEKIWDLAINSPDEWEYIG